MTGRLMPWPGTLVDDARASDGPATDAAPEDAALGPRLERAVDACDAPDVVFAVSRRGGRTIRSGGTAPPPPVPRPELRYELGSASKTFTGLLLTRLIQHGRLSGGEPAVACLAPGRAAGPAPVTLAHLVTHTAGLPSLPRDFFVRALPAWRTNPYARYPAPYVIDAFLRHRPRHRPGTRWHYSNFGVAVLGHAVAAVTATDWDELVAAQVLRPLALSETGPRPLGHGVDAVGHGKDGRTAVPAFDAGGFPAAGALRATPRDLLTFLEAHLDPPHGPLADALLSVRTPVLRRGLGHRHVHTVAWFRHPTGGGPMYFHGGATMGQQAFIGFRPDTGTALAALCTRRFRAGDPFVATAYSLLAEGLEE
ncbi:serine hydrolase domain-containing protein [Streptomyces sp. NPDC048751]|uniref:serine hydrolase domain-containing protein n=1 Tax=Streptomyces sp. NPDC048751 TaxID=3365591 RepID=UPI003716AAED